MGDAGKLLNKMLAAIDIKRESIYITNVVNYRPPNNRKPTTAEINKYSKFLYEHISIINPKILIIMGSSAMEALIGNNFKISNLNNSLREFIVQTSKPSEEVISNMGSKGFLAGIKYSDNEILVAVTEKRTKDEIDSYVSSLQEVDNA